MPRWFAQQHGPSEQSLCLGVSLCGRSGLTSFHVFNFPHVGKNKKTRKVQGQEEQSGEEASHDSEIRRTKRRQLSRCGKVRKGFEIVEVIPRGSDDMEQALHGAARKGRR